MKRILSLALAVLLVVSILPMSALASDFDATVSNDYFKVISESVYQLAPGASETELVLNNADGNDRKVVHYFSVDTKNENISVLPGYYGIDKLDPDNLALEGVADKSQFWKAEQLTKTVAYYEGLGYNVVGAMNTALAYDSDAPYGYMVMNGVVLGTPEVHKGAQTYLAIDAEGNCELRSMSTALDGSEVTAISANFGWLVKDGVLQTKTVERTSSDASRSMIGIKADGTLIFCQVDGRNAPVSTGLSNYEMGEMMLSLGCVNAVNCDGGGSSTFVSKREGEAANIMRSIPSDGSERATINSVILVSNAKATGEFDHAVLGADYDYYAPGTSATINVMGVDAAGSPAEVPTENVTWALDDASYGSVADGVFTSNGQKGDVTVKMLYNGEIVGEKLIHVVDPDVFALALDETVLPYGKTMTIDFACTYGVDDWAVCVDGVYNLTLSNDEAATLEGNTLIATKDESVLGVDVTATYTPDATVTDVLKVTYGKGSEILFDFEDGDASDFMGVDEMYDWAAEVGAPAPIQNNSNYSDEGDSFTFLSDASNGGKVRNGNYALGVTLDYTDAQFASWSYNMFFRKGDAIVLRDVENGMNATTLGVWVYIPEGAAGLAMQIQGYKDKAHTANTGAHFYFTTKSGAKKNLNSCSEADIPESRWVYATVDLTSFGNYFALFDSMGNVAREPSFIRFYIKPMTPANLTFYYDDFTLDYSSAVDDRVLPTISDVSYTTADESVALTDGATVNGNTVAFSATIADNMKLDYTTGKIIVDGNELSNVTSSGKYLASESITLTSGVHTVEFEIKDALGNPAKAIRTFTVSGDSVITLSGHNDSGEMAEYGSVYYIDVNVADITAINKLTAQLKLQTANAWEPQGITVADGFDVAYELDSLNGILTLNIERNDEDIDADATIIVSAPVRLWTWNGSNHVTDTPITPEAQYKTGYCPVVFVDCDVTTGTVEFVGNDYKSVFGAFGGNIYVETKINDTVYAWHYHDEELTVLNKDATCTANGYTGRTYCETCKSVIDWGTVVEATGHNFVDGACTVCGKQNTYTGLLEENGNWYYYVNGVTVSGWQMIGNEWYYFDPATKIGAEGDLVLNSVNYNFDNGRLTAGVWVKTLYGNKYYYGPNPHREGWLTVDGKDYCFDDYYTLPGGYQIILENNKYGNCYYFEADGSSDRTQVVPDGFVTDRNGYAYVKNGRALTGLQNINGDYYYFRPNEGYAVKGEYIGYVFGDDYKALNGLIEKDGTYYYYENGKGKMAGLVEVDGDYYFAKDSKGTCVTGEYYVWAPNGIVEKGNYTFGEDGKMLNGIVEKDGTYYYYENGKGKMAGLVEVDGDYYFAKDSKGTCVTGEYYVWEPNGIVEKGTYEFGDDGKLLNGIIERDGGYYYYDMGQSKMAGLVEVDGNYYFAKDNKGTCVTGEYYVWAPNGIVERGNYEFGEDGKLLDGIIERDGGYYYYDMGQSKMAGLIEVDGDYYFAKDSKGTCVTGVYYVWAPNGIVEKGNYEFGEDGKMLDGIIERDGGYYYYDMGQSKMAGLIEVNGDYYFAKDNKGTCVTGEYYVWAPNGIVERDTYEFGEDGKLLDGIIQKADGNYYYYKMGKPEMAGLIEVDGSYYFAKDSKGTCVTGEYYVWAPNGIVEKGNYLFGEDGKMLDGFVTRDDGIYYYEMGKAGKVGLNYIDGYYYFINYGAKLITSQSYYVWEPNGYTARMTYRFDELGRVVL